MTPVYIFLVLLLLCPSKAMDIRFKVHVDFSKHEVQDDGWVRQSHCTKLEGQMGWPNHIYHHMETSTKCETECDKDANCDFCITQPETNECFLANFQTESETTLLDISQATLAFKTSPKLAANALNSFEIDPRFSSVVLAQYVMEFGSTLTTHSIEECALTCAMSVNMSCDSFIFEHHQCNLLSVTNTSGIELVHHASTRIMPRSSIMDIYVSKHANFIAKAEEFVDKLNFGSLLYLEKNVTNISLDAMNHSKDMIVIANTMNYNTTAVLALKDDFSITTHGTLTVYAGLKGVKLCEFIKLDKGNQDCQWKMPIVTLVYHQGTQNGPQPTNHLEILVINE